MNVRLSSSRRTLVLSAVLVAVTLLLPFPANAAPGKCETLFIVDPVCEAGKTVADTAEKAVTAPFRYVAGSAVEMVTNWVADSAKWVLDKVIGLIDDSTSPNLEAEWFTERYRFMIGMAALVVLPLLLIAAIRALVLQDISQLTRSFLLYLPLAVLGTFIAVFLAQSLLAVTDAMSAAVARSIAGDVSQVFKASGETLTAPSPGAARPLFAIFFGALILIVSAFVVWLELIIRSAAVTVSVFFLPLILAGLVWPATARWTKRLIQTLIALIFSKFVIVAVISLATAALAEPGKGGFSAVMSGAALMTMAAFSPFALLKLFPIMEEAAVGHLQGMARKPIEAVTSGGSVNQALSTMRAKISPRETGQFGVAGTQPAGAGAASAAGVALTGGRTAAQTPGRSMARHIGGGDQVPRASSKTQPTKGATGSTSVAAQPPPQKKPRQKE